MRAFRFAKIAAEAERLRLTHMARRYAVRAMFGLVGAVFILAAVGIGHVAAWMALVTVLAPLYATLALAGADLVLAILFIGIAISIGPGRAEVEALALRRMAVAEIKPPSLLSLPLSGALISRLFQVLAGRLFRRRPNLASARSPPYTGVTGMGGMT